MWPNMCVGSFEDLYISVLCDIMGLIEEVLDLIRESNTGHV